uniref:Uncharacterized protein n=1 Tax=Neogobius melanostomus TaxID=47308 RepID=A0A8C6T656_9GOBI
MSNLDFNCPVCLEVYKNPVVLSCCHSFCKACLQDWWTQKVTRECPVCKRRSSRTDPPCNLVLKNLCEAFSQQLTLGETSAQASEQLPEQPVPLCPQHKEKLQLYCVDHHQLVCLVCRDSRAHHRHRFSPIDEMAQECREQLRKSLKPQQELLEDLVKVEILWDGTAEHIKQQGQHTERLIQRQFDQMRAFLQREEQTRIRALRTEVEQKTQQMDRSRAALKQEQTKLSETIQATEAQLKCDDVSLLQNYAPDMKILDKSDLNIEPLPSGTLVNVAKHLGNLSFNIWSQMKEIVSYTPVVLDPNTANPFLTVSDDLQSVQYNETDTALFIDNPDRNNSHLMVFVCLYSS